MYEKFIYRFFIVLVLGFILSSPASADLVAWWTFDEGAGTTAADSSGNGNDGTLNGGTQWVDGQLGGAIEFNGSNSYVSAPHIPLNDQSFTIAMWVNPVLYTGEQVVFAQHQTGSTNLSIHFRLGGPGSGNVPAGGVRMGFYSNDVDTAGGLIQDNNWYHLTFWYDAQTQTQRIYIDGVQMAERSPATPFQGTSGETRIGQWNNNQWFRGIIDDVRVYDTPLTDSEIRLAMIGIPPGVATEPSPADRSTDVPRDVVLSWTPGDFVPATNGHIVYLSESFGDVNDGIGGIRQNESRYKPGRLAFNTMYYWRVDEVNAPPDSTVHKGSIWNFTTEPVAYPIDGANIIATASSVGQADFGPEKTIDGSGLDADSLHSTNAVDMWLSSNEPSGAWIQYEFDKPYKLHEMWVWNSNQVFEGLFGFGFKDVTVEYSTDGAAWTPLADVSQFTKAPGKAGYVHDTTVDFGGTAAKYVKLTATSNWGGVLPQYGLSEVRFFAIPVSAREPSPDSGAADVNPAVSLAWRAGREAGTHDVYLSTDEQAVIDGTAPAVSVTGAGYSTDLDLAETYYWRIDEVNDVETPTTWQGDVWNFATSEYLVVDDFESYNDIDPPDPESNRIFESWIDGYGVATNGALVGYDPPQPSYAETVTIQGGAQAMPLFYSNTAGATSSEATRTFAPGRDWTRHGIATLVLYFQGMPGNTGQLYVKINGVKAPYPGDATDIARLLWTQWAIDLASLGVTLTNITTLAVGIDGNGAAGTLYVDDIVLYRLAPPEPAEQIWLEAEAGNITAPLTVRNDPLASGGSYIGTDDGTGDENNAPPATGVATYNFTAQGGVYTISLRVIITGGSNSFWVRIPGATSYAPGTHTSGWIRFNDISDGADWHWDEVHSNDHNNQVVSITVPAGPQTLEIARREDGALLDAIVISKID